METFILPEQEELEPRVSPDLGRYSCLSLAASPWYALCVILLGERGVPITCGEKGASWTGLLSLSCGIPECRGMTHLCPFIRAI